MGFYQNRKWTKYNENKWPTEWAAISLKVVTQPNEQLAPKRWPKSYLKVTRKQWTGTGAIKKANPAFKSKMGNNKNYK